MTSQGDPPGMQAVAHRHFSSQTICKYYRYSGTCRYRRCGHSHVSEALPTDGMHKHEPLPSVQERPWALSSGEESSSDEGDAESWRFSVASYNILADKYAKHYRSYLYHDVPSGYLDWAHRRSAIVAELAHLQPDIICLQEVDRYDDLEEELQQLGYSGIYLQRDGSRRDGCATFWRSSLLRPALVRQLWYSQYDLKDNVALFVLFEPHTEASAAQQELQPGIEQQQQVQPLMSNPQLLQQQLQEEQHQQRHKQDLLSQWLPRGWLHGSHHQHHHHQQQQQHRALARSGSLGSPFANSSSGNHSIYQQPADVMQSTMWRSQTWAGSTGNSSSGSKGRHNSRSSRHGRRHSSRVESHAYGATAASWDGIQQQPQQLQVEPMQLAPDWHKCGILVANTHIIFTPDKGEVKLGQARMLVQEAADMARWYLQQQQPQQEQQQQQRQPMASAAGQTSSSSTSSRVNDFFMETQATEDVIAQSAAAAGKGCDGVVTVIAGDFNATPNSPIYTFMAQGQVNLHRVNRRNVSHMTSGGSHSHKGYRGFRRLQKRKSVEDQRRSLEHQRSSLEQRSAFSGLPSMQNSSSTAEEQGSVAAYAVQASAGSSELPANATGNLSSTPVRMNSITGGSSSYPSPGSPPQSSKLFSWSDKECRRAAGMSYEELLEASSSITTSPSAAVAAASDRPASPGTKIAKAAVAFGARVAAGAGAAAASVAASAAAELGGPFDALRGAPADGVGPLLLRHDLQLQSSYMSVLGREPEYTSSHSQFMDTCDYIWYTETALSSSTLQDQQQLQPPGQPLLSSNVAGDSDADTQQQGSRTGERAAENAGYALKPVAVLVPPDGMKLPKGLPSRWLGSDHVCLVADFELTPQRA